MAPPHNENPHSSLNNHDFTWVLDRALDTYNRRPAVNGYAPFSLALGHEDHMTAAAYVAYEREPTEEEEAQQVADFVKIDMERRAHRRAAVASGKASRDFLRQYLQERKARLRNYGTGDWVLRVRERKHKGEPYYDGPYLVVAGGTDDAYTLRTPGGVVLNTRYHGQQLFPAYVRDGHPVRSLWYGNKTMLDKDRALLARQLKPWDDVDRAAAEGAAGLTLRTA